MVKALFIQLKVKNGVEISELAHYSRIQMPSNVGCWDYFFFFKLLIFIENERSPGE